SAAVPKRRRRSVFGALDPEWPVLNGLEARCQVLEVIHGRHDHGCPRDWPTVWPHDLLHAEERRCMSGQLENRLDKKALCEMRETARQPRRRNGPLGGTQGCLALAYTNSSDPSSIDKTSCLSQASMLANSMGRSWSAFQKLI